jgi:hypothetical protein
MRTTRGFVAALIAATAAVPLSACATSASLKTAPQASKSAPQASEPSPSRSQGQLAALPGAQFPGGGAGFQKVAAGQGVGAHDIGTFPVRNHAKIFFQLSCQGGSPVTIAGLYVVGPCDEGDLIATVTTTTTTSRLDVTVQAPPKVSWAIYVSQPISAKNTSPD